MTPAQHRHHIFRVFTLKTTSCSESHVYDFGGKQIRLGCAAEISQRNMKQAHMDVWQIMFKTQKENVIYTLCSLIYVLIVITYDWFLCLSLRDNNRFGARHIIHTQREREKSVVISLKNCNLQVLSLQFAKR